MAKKRNYTGEQIREWRHRLGVSLSSLALASQVNISTCSQIERGLRTEIPHAKIQEALLEIEKTLKHSGRLKTRELRAAIELVRSTAATS